MNMNLAREGEKWSDMRVDRDIDMWVFDINSGINCSRLSGINYSRMKIMANSDIDAGLQLGKYTAGIPAMNLKPIFEIEKVAAMNIAMDSNMLFGIDPDMDSDTKDLNMTNVLLQ